MAYHNSNLGTSEGSIITFSDTNVGGADIKALESALKRYKGLFHQEEYGFGMHTDADRGRIRIVTNAKSDQKIVQDMIDEVNSLINTHIATNQRLNLTAGQVTKRTDDISTPRQRAASKALEVSNAMDVRLNPDGQTVTSVFAENEPARLQLRSLAGASADIQNTKNAILQQRADNDLLKIRESDPTTPEGRRKIYRENNKRVARDRAMLAWARANPNSKFAKGILKRNETDGQRRLAGLKNMAGRQVINAVVGLIKAGVDTMVKFLSSLPALAEDVRKMANKGSRLNIATGQMLRLQELEGNLPGLEKGAIGNFYYSIHKKFADIVSAGGNVESAISTIAPVLSKGPHMKVITDMINYSLSDPSHANIAELGNAILNAILTVSLQGKTVTAEGLAPSHAARTNLEILSRAVGGGDDLGYALVHMLGEVIERHKVITVAKGGQATIGGTTFSNYDTLETLLAAILGDPSLKRSSDAATSAEVKLLEEISRRLSELGAIFEGVFNSIRISIGAQLGELVRFGEWMTKGILKIADIPGGDSILAHMDINNYNRNIEYAQQARAHAELADRLVIGYGISAGFLPSMFDEHGQLLYNTPEEIEEYNKVVEEKFLQLVNSYHRGEGVPRTLNGQRVNPSEWTEFMVLYEHWREAFNTANKADAMNRAFLSMNEPQMYITVEQDGRRKEDNSYTHREIGNFNAIQPPTPAFFESRAVNNVKRTNRKFTNMTEGIERMTSGSFWERVRGGYQMFTNGRAITAWAARNVPFLELYDPTGAFRQTLDNAEALVDYYASDGLDPYGNVQNGRDSAGIRESRMHQSNVFSDSMRIQGLNILDEIRKQAGENYVARVLSGEIQVHNRLTFGEQRFSIDLNYTDESGRQRTKTITDIHNYQSEKPDFTDSRWTAFYNAQNLTR